MRKIGRFLSFDDGDFGTPLHARAKAKLSFSRPIIEILLKVPPSDQPRRGGNDVKEVRDLIREKLLVKVEHFSPFAVSGEVLRVNHQFLRKVLHRSGMDLDKRRLFNSRLPAERFPGGNGDCVSQFS